MLARLLGLSLAAAAALMLMTACGGDDTTDEPAGYSGGAFTMTLSDVTDGCFDGAMKTLILGADLTTDLPGKTTLPALGALPSTVDLVFNPPFEGQTGVPVEKDGENALKTTGAGVVNTGIDLYANDANIADPCLMDMTISAAITVVDANKVTGTATINVTKAEGNGCSQAFTDAAAAAGGCTITLKLTGNK